LGGRLRRATILRASWNGQACDSSATSLSEAVGASIAVMIVATPPRQACGAKLAPRTRSSSERAANAYELRNRDTRKAAPHRQTPSGQTIVSKRADREVAEPQIGEPALFPIAKQGPAQSLPQQIIAAFDRNAHALAKIPALQKRAATEYAAAGGIGTIEPERQRDSVAEQKIDILVAQRFARGFRIGVRPHLGRGEHLLEESLMRGA